MNEINLPPLPEPETLDFTGDGNTIYGFETGALQAYALAAVEKDRAERGGYVPVDSKLRDGNWNHPNDKEPRSAACIQALNARGDNEGQGLDGFWKWGFAVGFNAALAAAPQPQPVQTGKRCEPCRSTGLVHCAHPDECGGPWTETTTQPVQPIMDRADDLHNKAGMPWEQAEKLALEECGIGDPEIDEMIGNCSTSAVVSLLHEEEVREFARSIAVQQYRIDARTALRDAMNKSSDIAGYMRKSAPQPVHTDDLAVDKFAAAMKAKLAAARDKGRGGWEECSQTELSRMLREHVEKGDPCDVANFCMFLWSLGFGIASQPVQREPLMDEQISAIHRSIEHGVNGVAFGVAVARAVEAAHGITKKGD